jgi:hypothetical protein
MYLVWDLVKVQGMTVETENPVDLSIQVFGDRGLQY